MRDTLQKLEEEYGDREKLADFFNFAANLPDSLEYVTLYFNLRSPSRVKERRRAFERKKANIYRHIGQNFTRELLDMSIPHAQIDRMVQEGLRPKSFNGEYLDFSIDHILSLSLGGKNNYDNLCLLPGKLNHFKSILEGLQIQKKGGKQVRKGTILTIVPRLTDGRRTLVPFVEGGFKPRIKNAGLMSPNEPHR